MQKKIWLLFILTTIANKIKSTYQKNGNTKRLNISYIFQINR